MANINPTVNHAPQGASSVKTAQWALGIADTGNPVTLTNHADRSVQVEGTFGGATVTVQGSNDGQNWETLRDPLGNLLTFTAAGLKQVLEMTIQTRVVSSGGTGTAVTATMAFRAMFPNSWN